MKKGIHPKYLECKVTCGCGETFETRATQPEIHVEICSKCHPFYTGKQKLVDTAGRVEKFERRYAKFQQLRKDQEDTDEGVSPAPEPQQDSGDSAPPASEPQA